MVQLTLPRPHHAARLRDSERLQKLDKYLIEKGKAGATTYEIMAACLSTGPARDIDELRKNGINVVCKYERTNENGRKVFRYWHPAFLGLLLLLLGSCKIVTPGEMRRAEAACKAHGGLEYAKFALFLEEAASVKCQNGMRGKVR